MIYEKEGLEAYCKYQIEHEDETLKPGAGFPLVQAILKLNEKIPNKRITEVIIMSRNNADRSLRIFNSIDNKKENKYPSHMVRYADDYACCFGSEFEAKEFLRHLKKRLKKFNLA